MKYVIATLGCKVNQFETQAMEALLQAHGHVPATAGDADAVIVNTCAVTAESGRKSRQALRRLLKENPGALAAVCGCWSQLSPEEPAALGARVVYGAGDRAAFVRAVEAAVADSRGETRTEVEVRVKDPFRRLELEPLPAGALEGRTRAYLKIEDGCDNFCAYCVIPYARGRVRSLPLDVAAVEAARLQKDGFRELVATGIEISSYGKDLPGKPGLADVVCAMGQAAPEVRIRLSSLEPTVVTEDFCAALAGCHTVCPHFHLSLQSGCDRTLRAMNRKYDTARFSAAAALLRRFFPGCALTGDLITGFPGEREEDFAQTLSFLREMRFAALHVFPFSPRPGTRAAGMEGQVPPALREQRAAAAGAVARALRKEYLEAQVGQTLPVLFETEKNGLWQGHSGTYCLVCANGSGLHGIMRNVKIISVQEQKLMGIIV